ncbi:MAG: hypothetical protein IPM24_03355 [Bryobacterales bacterium]|nr:hypothetical protein [Bryobacterales bacterium]
MRSSAGTNTLLEVGDRSAKASYNTALSLQDTANLRKPPASPAQRSRSART